MKKIAIVGATGYTGSELVRLLQDHNEVEIMAITSESYAGEPFSEVHPAFKGIEDRPLVSVKDLGQFDIDLAFLALPHGVSMDYVKQFAGERFRIVDFSGDFRLTSAETYEAWYGKKHSYEQGFEDAVYGLPELFAGSIAQAHLVANPGCFPTGAILALAPLIKGGWINLNNIIIDSKTGVTGAGIKANKVNMYSNVNENFKAYGLKTHRHSIEIQEVLGALTTQMSPVQFTPHLLPVDRGILTTAYAQPVKEVSAQQLQKLYKNFYSKSPFVQVLEAPPALKDVRGTNLCKLYVDYDERTGNILLISAIDNLVKGAAGQAIQNMNLMLGMNETAGLHQVPVNP